MPTVDAKPADVPTPATRPTHRRRRRLPRRRSRAALMTDTRPRALIFMTGRNCAAYVTAALESLAWQTHGALHVLFVDDGSDDDTGEIARQVLAQHFDGRHTLVRNGERWGKARNAHVHLRAALHEGDFVAVLDADDQLIRATAVAELASEYAAGFDVVWTTYETDTGLVGGNGPLDPLRAPRGQGWRSSHFFSFRADLLRAVTEDYFQDERGDWLQAACDLAIAYPVLDQTRRWRYLPLRSYRYTASNPASHHNQDPQSRGFNSRAQQRAAEIVLAKPALPCRRWLLADHGAADHALALALQRAAALPATPAAAVAPAPAPAPAATDAWTQTAAATLTARCPALLNLVLDGQDAAPDAALLWRWWQWLQRGGGASARARAPQVLEIGAGPLTAPLHALVHGLGGRITSVCADRDAALALYARLHSAGLDAEVLHAPLAEAEFDGVQARFPDLATLPDDAAGYDVAIVGSGCSPDGARAALLALPMLAPRLSGDGFRVCLWSPDDPAPLRDAQASWERAAPELVYSAQALAGAGLVVHSAHDDAADALR